MGIVFGVVAMGIYITFRVIDFADLTCDGSFVLGAAVCSVLLSHDMVPPFIAVIAAMVAGALAGVWTGILYTRLNVSALLSGILVAFMLYSINLDVMLGQPNIVLLGKPLLFDGVHTVGALMLMVLGVWAILSYILSTDFGLALKSIGQNQRLALNGGINVKKMTLFGLGLSNALIALGGSLFCQIEGFSDITLGPGTVIFGLAAVMIGERLMPGRHIAIGLFSCVMGSIVYRLLMSLAMNSEWIGLRTKDLNLVTGILVLIVMQLSYHKRGLWKKRGSSLEKDMVLTDVLVQPTSGKES